MKIREIESLCRVALLCNGLDPGGSECYLFAMKHCDVEQLEVEAAVVVWAHEEHKLRWAKVREYLR